MTSTDVPDADSATAILAGVVKQIQFARSYTLELLDATPQELWFQMPEQIPTHVAWQVGHLAVSQYGLLMFRIRGRDPDDLDLIPGRFRKAYSRQSTPGSDAFGQMSPDELRERLSQVHERAMQELTTVAAETLLEPVDMPFAGYPTKLGAIMFCPLHEQIHAGQIGVIRRGLGLDPIR